VTAFLIDLASYQHGINLAAVKAAGFTRVNIKLTEGASYVDPYIGEFVDGARANGLDICTFHWLNGRSSGASQAAAALAQMDRFGLRDGTAHQCDCEDTTSPATWAIWRDYINAMQQALGRPVINYTGDWWWPAHMGSNNGAAVTPYLWAAPNHGYDTTYPGDSSSDWHAGYGGWGDYAALQYAVSSIPGAGGTDPNLSKTAFRDPHVWTALTGVDAATSGGTVTPEEIQAIATAVGAEVQVQIGLWRLDAVQRGAETVQGGPMKGEPMWLVQAVKDLQAKVAKMSAPTQDQIDAAVAKVLNDPAWMAALVALLPHPPTAGEIAKAVNDDAAARLQS
jgi:hypothetical protein